MNNSRVGHYTIVIHSIRMGRILSAVLTQIKAYLRLLAVSFGFGFDSKAYYYTRSVRERSLDRSTASILYLRSETPNVDKNSFAFCNKTRTVHFLCQNSINNKK